MNRLVQSLIGDFLDKPLKDLGFKRKVLVWNRPRSAFIDVVDLQLSRLNDASRANFTLNLGVFSPSVYQSCWQKGSPRWVQQTDCSARSRLYENLGASSRETLNKWWDLKSSSDVPVVASEVLDLFTLRAVPWFERLNSLEALHDYLERETHQKKATPLTWIYLAIVKAELGNNDAARDVLCTLKESAPAAWHPRISAVLQEVDRRVIPK